MQCQPSFWNLVKSFNINLYKFITVRQRMAFSLNIWWNINLSDDFFVVSWWCKIKDLSHKRVSGEFLPGELGWYFKEWRVLYPTRWYKCYLLAGLSSNSNTTAHYVVEKAWIPLYVRVWQSVWDTDQFHNNFRRLQIETK